MRQEVSMIVHEGTYNQSEVGHGPVFIFNKSERTWDDILGIQLHGEPIADQCIIFVPVDFFNEWDAVAEDDIRTLLRHELGHYRTWEQFAGDLKEERFRDCVFELILEAYPAELTHNEYTAEHNFFRHRLPSERVASESVGITKDDIRRVFLHQLGIEPTNEFPGVDVHRLLTKPVSVRYDTVTQDNVAEVLVEFVSDIITDADVLARFPAVAEDWFALCQ